MELTISTLAKHLGATGLETAGSDARFAVLGRQGGQLKVSVFGAQQRFMGVLSDDAGVVRCSVDVAPVAHVTEDAAFPGRVTLHVGKALLHIDTIPSLSMAVTTLT